MIAAMPKPVRSEPRPEHGLVFPILVMAKGGPRKGQGQD